MRARGPRLSWWGKRIRSSGCWERGRGEGAAGQRSLRADQISRTSSEGPESALASSGASCFGLLASAAPGREDEASPPRVGWGAGFAAGRCAAIPMEDRMPAAELVCEYRACPLNWALFLWGFPVSHHKEPSRRHALPSTRLKHITRRSCLDPAHAEQSLSVSQKSTHRLDRACPHPACSSGP